jgi:RHS repeat-associated protein
MATRLIGTAYRARPGHLIKLVAVGAALALAVSGLTASSLTASSLAGEAPVAQLAAATTTGGCPGSGSGTTGAPATTDPVPDFQAIVSPNDAKASTVSFGGATLTIDPTAVTKPVSIGVSQLALDQVPKLDPEMTNVTARPVGGYQFTPHPFQFAKMIQVSLPYDPALIDGSLTAQDIYTYFYDDVNLCWVPLQRVKVDEVAHQVVSLTDHFTDMINSTVLAPESPEGVNVNPNQIKGIQTADPGSGIDLIAPPSGNNQGTNQLSYPIEVPPGRHGMQPKLAVNYDSSRGNGWMGVGWNLATPTITVDTRWGVPRYDADSETETYLLNGEQLTPVAHRGAPPPRTAEKEFHTRVEGDFARIVRHGDSPRNYTWEVTDKAGTRWRYGGSTADTTLTDDAGDIFSWPLREVSDATGDVMRYSYVTQDDFGVEGGVVHGRDLYLKRISYTGDAGSDGHYTVTFIRDRDLHEPDRADKMIDARGGFKRVTGDLLRKVEVAFESSLVRRYEFTYTTGAFAKTLLASVTQFDADGNALATHRFDYFDDIRDDQGRYQAFGSTPWTSPDDGLGKAELNLTPDHAGDASAINASTSSGGGGHLYVGVGDDSGSKSQSAGLKVGFNHTDDAGLLALIDVDGDALPDKVFRKDNATWYRKNLSGPDGTPRFAPDATRLDLPGIMAENSDSLTMGLEAYAGSVAAQLDYVNTFAATDRYFTDVNGDDIMDLVDGPSVLFGRIGPDRTPVYGVSADTPVPVRAGKVDTGGLFGDFAADRDRLVDSFPLLDTVRRWVAPYDGTVRIDGPVKLDPATRSARDTSRTADGVRVAIQLEDDELWSDRIEARDNADHTPDGVSEVQVKRGQRLYFRVQSVFDGDLDQVSWDPAVSYTGVTGADDVNGLPGYDFQASRDFTLGGRTAQVKVPLTGTMHLSGDVTKKGVTTDDVTVLITADGAPLLEKQLAGGDAPATAPVDLDVPVRQGQILKWRIKVDSPIDLDQVSWTPRAFYTAADGVDRVTGTDGKPLIDLYPPYNVDMYPVDNLTAPQGSYHVPTDGDLTVEPALAFDFGDKKPNATVAFTVKRRGALLGKRMFTIKDGQVSGPGSVTVPAHAGDDLFFDFSTLDPTLAASLTQRSVTVFPDNTVPPGITVPSAFHSAAVEGAFPQPYRGWGVVGYNGNRDRAGNPIVQNDLKIDEHFGDQLPDPVDPQAQKDEFGADPRVHPPTVTPFIPSPRHDRWETGDRSWVSRAAASSSRLGSPSVALPSPSDFADRTTVPKLARSQQISLTGSAGGSGGSLGGSVATGDSTGQVDYIDLNGDQFPDVLGAGGIQYSDPDGGLGARHGQMPDGAVRKVDNRAGNASAGSAARTISTGRGYASPPGHTSAGTADQGNDMAPLGVGGSFGGNSSDSVFDLLDLNGDGLPDRVYSDGRVALNVGYSFARPEQWRNPAALNDGGGTDASINIGFNTDFYGFAGGASFNVGRQATSSTLMDMNGDGLLDRVFDDDPLRVALNTGNGFTDPVQFRGSLSAVNGDANAKLGGGAYVTIPICFLVACVIINPGGDLSEGVSRTEVAIRDINGDGFADQLASTRDGQLTVAQNRTGRTNLLRVVTRPLGGRMDFDYQRDGNTYDQPESRYDLSRVALDDGHSGDGQDVRLTTYEYRGGTFDRLEREFDGYATVTARVRDAGAGDAVFRSVTRDYRTDGHYTRGLLTRELTADAAGRPFTETQNTYTLQEVGAGVAAPHSTTATVFPQLTRTDRRWFEGQANPGKTTFTANSYDEFGNLTRVFDAADAGTADDVDTRMRYTADIAACRDSNIVGTPDGIDVFGGGHLIRSRESTVDCTTGNVTQVRSKLASGDAAVNDLEYFGNGNLKAVIGPPNKDGQRYRLDYGYDPVVATHVESVTDSFGLRSTTTHNLKFGLVEKSTDANGQVTRSSYDAAGRPSTVVGPYEAANNETTIGFEYHPDAATPYAVTRHIDRQADAVHQDTIDTIQFVDGLDRVIQTKKDASVSTGPDTAPQIAMIVSGRVNYDFAGRAVEQLYPTTEAKGAANTTFQAMTDTVAPTRTTYDVLDRPTRIVLPDNTTASTAYGFGPDRAGVTQFEQIATDGNGKSKRTYRDVRQLTTAIKEFDPAGGQPVIWTSYGYDPLGQATSATDDHLNVTTAAYDNLGRQTVVDSPDAGETEVDYDLAGNQIKKITAKLAADHLAIEYDYDFTRIKAVRYPVFPANNVSYTYGAPGAPANAAGRITHITDGAGQLSREYGPLGEVTKETRFSAAQGSHTYTFTTSYRYDTWNRMLSMTFPDGEDLTYHYDSGGQVDSATGVKGDFTYQYLKRLDYDKFGQRVLLDNGNGTRTRYTYNADDRRLANLNARLGQGYVFQNLNYDYDDVGNVTAVHNDTEPPSGPSVGTQVGGPSTQTFGYDDLYRLVHAEGSYQPRTPKLDKYSFDLSYDSINNITHKSQTHQFVSNGNTTTDGKTSYDYPYAYAAAQPHAASTIGIYTLNYDANGNQISREQQPKPRRQLIWDEENRLACSHENVQSTTLPQTPASCDNPGGTPNDARYAYDDHGTRIIKDSSQFHIYPNQNYSTDGNKQYKHIYIGDTKLLTKFVEPAHRIEDRQFYSHADQLGSTGFITDSSGGLAEHLQYFPGGETWVDEHPSQPVPQQFTGKEFDPETNMYYYGARYYDPRTEVWQSPDPAVGSFLAGTPNGGAFTTANLALYSYAYNNPVGLVDPTGAFPWGRVLGVVKMVGGALEAGAGVAIGTVSSWTGIGAVGGAAIAVHGLDVMYAGSRQAAGEKDVSTFTSQAIQGAGVSKRNADLIDAGISIAGTAGAAGLARAGPAAVETGVRAGTEGATTGGAAASTATATGEAAEAGTATIFQYGKSHVSIMVKQGENVMHTEQVITNSTSKATTIMEATGEEATNVFELALPNASKAMQYQRSVIGEPLGPYDFATNSCVTHCGDVLRAGGLEVPKTTMGMLRWMRETFGQQ